MSICFRVVIIFVTTSLILDEIPSAYRSVDCTAQNSSIFMKIKGPWKHREITADFLHFLLGFNSGTAKLLMNNLMCGCGCSIISSLMKRLGRTACCSDLLSCSHTSETLQRLSTSCPPRTKVTTRTSKRHRQQ